MFDNVEEENYKCGDIHVNGQCIMDILPIDLCSILSQAKGILKYLLALSANEKLASWRY